MSRQTFDVGHGELWRQCETFGCRNLYKVLSNATGYCTTCAPVPKPDDKLVLEGECTLTEQEGGFCAPDIWIGNLIGGESFDRSLYRWIHGELPAHDRGGCVDHDHENLGRLRITVERLPDE